MKKSVWQKRYETLRAALKKMRKHAGLTQVELSSKLDKPQSYVSKYENGERNLDFLEVLEVCEACQASPTDLIAQLKQDA